MSDEVEDLLREVREQNPSPSPKPSPSPSPSPTPTPTQTQRPESSIATRMLALRQASIVASREIDLKLGDVGGTLLLLGQAPIIAWLIGVAFAGKTEDNTLDFVLSMVATWFGCFNASRELVKERAIFLRERRTGLQVRAYLGAKLGVLLLLCAIQCLILVVIVGQQAVFKGAPALVFLTTFLTAAAASGLGLLISAASPSQTIAMAVVPIVLIPQLIFSDAVLRSAGEGAKRIQDVMLASWGYELLKALRPSLEWGNALKCSLVLAGSAAGLLLIASLFLRLQDEE